MAQYLSIGMQVCRNMQGFVPTTQAINQRVQIMPTIVFVPVMFRELQAHPHSIFKWLSYRTIFKSLVHCAQLRPLSKNIPYLSRFFKESFCYEGTFSFSSVSLNRTKLILSSNSLLLTWSLVQPLHKYLTCKKIIQLHLTTLLDI